MSKVIKFAIEVADDVDPEAFLEVMTIQIHEVRTDGKDEHDQMLDKVINVGLAE